MPGKESIGFRKSIDYCPFSDAQLSLFEESARLKYEGEFLWRPELDQAATDFIIDYYHQQWDSPSRLVKELKKIERNPSVIIDYLAKDIDAVPMPLSAVLCHGTGWTMEQLAKASEENHQFLAGVVKEIQFLLRLIEKRKEMGISGNKGNPALRCFVNQLSFVYQDAFLQGANVGLSIPYGGGTPTGPFLRYAKAVLSCLEQNLSKVVRETDPQLPSLLKRLSLSGDTSISQHLLRSEYYGLVTGEGRI